MTNPMVKHVALAVHEAREEWINHKFAAADGLDEQPEYGIDETIARAAMEAMRKPTEEMLNAACAYICEEPECRHECKNVFDGHGVAKELHHSVIDAALKDSKP